MSEYEDEEYEVPLRDQRYFGAGLKRKRVQFVAATDHTPSTTATTPIAASPQTASERYLSIVLQKKEAGATLPFEGSPISTAPRPVNTLDGSLHDVTNTHIETCAVCRLPITVSGPAQPHESSLAHQVCLPHSHPPSALDRRRKGMNILQAYGWNPDKRIGLGATGEGILHPIKVKEKRDKIGLGVVAGNDADNRSQSIKQKQSKKSQAQKLDAGKIRRLDAENRKRDQRMRDMFYRNDEVEKYLGGDG